MPDTSAALEAAYRDQSRRVLATLLRLLGGFDEAEEALHEAFAAAAEHWPRSGVPDNPYAWLVSAGRFKTVDRYRRRARLEGALPELAARAEEAGGPIPAASIEDDELRLIFTCCHPALSPDARIALTLREVARLRTEEIARAYLCPTPTIAQRIVRAKAKLKSDGVAYEVPEGSELTARLESVLHVVYLIFNEGFAATEAEQLVRDELCRQALELGRLVCKLVDEPEALGLLALMLLHHARRAARVDASGDLVLLEHQDRSRWDQAAISEARGLIERALAAKRVGPYLLQAAIGDVHVSAASFERTNWQEIVALYDVLRRVEPSPVVELNRAVAIGMRDGAAAGLVAVDAALADGKLEQYHLAHAARADLLQRVGQTAEACVAYTRALQLVRQPGERRLLEARLAKLTVLPEGDGQSV